MTKGSDQITVEEKTVVIFDICSSSKIVENLIVRDNLVVLRNSLIRVKKFLERWKGRAGFEPYKFIGDGWILLFPAERKLTTVLPFLERLTQFYRLEYRDHVRPALETNPRPTGLKFGIDCGRLVRIVMMGKREYVGRPLNIAARLQSALSTVDPSPGYKVLMPVPVYSLLGKADAYDPEEVKVPLKNIQGNSAFKCVKLALGSIARV